MVFFKKKVDAVQFLADLIFSQFDFLESNFTQLADLADEFNVLTEVDREELFNKASELVIVDIVMSCNQNFYDSISSEEAGKAVGTMYRRYLTEYKKAPELLVGEKLSSVMRLFELVGKVEESNFESPREFENEIESQKFYLCSGFRNYYVEENIKSENWEGKGFAAFKFAKAIVKADIVRVMMKDYNVIWD